MRPLRQPKVLIMIAPAMIEAALGPKIIYAAAVATRSSVAYCMPRAATVAPAAAPERGSRQRYATFARQ